MKLKGKVAIVTGGSQGIGEAICHAYAKEGAKVIIINKNKPEFGAKVADTIRQGGGAAESVVCDVSDEDLVNSTVNYIIDKYNKVDILVNNAAVAVFKKFEDQTLDDWDFLMNTNLKGPFLMSKALVPHMKKQNYGKIIFISSIASSKGFPLLSIYSATKGGILAMAKTMVTELSRYNINVNSISPGSTDTPQNEPFITDQEFLRKISERTASRVPMKPNDLTGAAVFLASDDSSAVHGLDLIVDNAWTTF